MIVLIAGSRSLKNPTLVSAAVEAAGFSPITEIVTGGAEGIDTLADQWAKDHGIDRVVMPANWKKYKRAGGYHRNERMVNYADAVIVIWDGKSNGTRHTIQIAQIRKKPIHIFLA